MRFGWISFLCCLFLVVTVHAADWELVTRDGREYVTLKSFCDFYHFPYSGIPQSDTLRLKNNQGSVVVKLDSRETFINGVRYWLSFSVEESKGDWLVSRLDLVKLYEPILRPGQIEGKRKVLGVVIDAGHGGSDNGATSSRGVMEKTLTLDTAYRLEKDLNTAGFKTVMTRRSDVYVDLYERAQRSAAFDGYIFVSLHYNSASPDARGLETYASSPRGAGSTMAGGVVTRSDYQKSLNNDTDNLNVLLASEVHRCIIGLNPGDTDADRGVKRARFVVLRQNTVPSILVEGGFLSHRMEASVLATPQYRQKLADAVAQGIANYASWMLPPEKRITPQVVRQPEPPKPAKPATTATATASAPVTPAKPSTPAPQPSAPAPAPSAPEKTPPPPPSTPVEPAPEPSSPTSTASQPAAPSTPAPNQDQPEPSTTIYPDTGSQPSSSPSPNSGSSTNSTPQSTKPDESSKPTESAPEPQP